MLVPSPNASSRSDRGNDPRLVQRRSLVARCGALPDSRCGQLCCTRRARFSRMASVGIFSDRCAIVGRTRHRGIRRRFAFERLRSGRIFGRAFRACDCFRRSRCARQSRRDCSLSLHLPCRTRALARGAAFGAGVHGARLPCDVVAAASLRTLVRASTDRVALARRSTSGHPSRNRSAARDRHRVSRRPRAKRLQCSTRRSARRLPNADVYRRRRARHRCTAEPRRRTACAARHNRPPSAHRQRYRSHLRRRTWHSSSFSRTGRGDRNDGVVFSPLLPTKR